MAARTVRMPDHSTRAAMTDSTVTTSPEVAREAKDTQPTVSAKPACSATISCTRARPCATFAHTKLSTLEKAGAPETSATARLTTAAGAAGGKSCLAHPRRGRPLDQPEREAQQSPRKYLAAEHAFRERAGSDGSYGHARKLNGEMARRTRSLTIPAGVCSYRIIGFGSHHVLQHTHS